MNWIVEVFSDKSDQAHLITILISAMVAIFVVLLNQRFVSIRSKRELLIEKIEELFSASIEYISSCRELMDSIDQQDKDYAGSPYEYPSNSVNKLNDSITKMQMICGLYFRAENFYPDDFYIWRMPILEIVHKGGSSVDEKGWMACKDSKAHIIKSRKKLDDLCNKLMRKYGD